MILLPNYFILWYICEFEREGEADHCSALAGL